MIGAIVLGACSPPAPEAETPPMAVSVSSERGPFRQFAFKTIDGRVVSSQRYEGRMTVVALVATYDTASQAQTRFLQTVFQRHTPRINALLLVLEPPEHLPLVEAYQSSLALSYDVALADEDTVAGKGPFPGLHHVPSIVLLDREGREVWRNLGLVEVEALHAAIADHDDRAR
jgi:hypothetical protein